jgi:hypothetical protein
MNTVTGSGFVAKCLNMIAELSFKNSVTGSGFVAKCSNILQDTTDVPRKKNEEQTFQLLMFKKNDLA